MTTLSTSSPETDRTLGAVLKDIAGNLQQMVRAEFRLARAEIGDEVAKIKRGALLMIGGGIGLVLALGLALLGAVYALSAVMPAWAAALLVGSLVAAAGGMLVSVGARQFKQVTLPPPRTVATVEESVQWAKSRAK